MKTKYYGLICLAVIILTLLASTYYVHFMSEKTKGAIGRIDSQKMPEITYPSDKEMERLQNMQKKLALLSFPRNSSSRTDLRLFNHDSRSADTGSSRNMGREEDQPNFRYSISFAFISGTNRYCSIDGKFYSEGDVLPDGARVATIENNRVLIAKQYTSEWVPVTSKGNAPENNQENSTAPHVPNPGKKN